MEPQQIRHQALCLYRSGQIYCAETSTDNLLEYFQLHMGWLLDSNLLDSFYIKAVGPSGAQVAEARRVACLSSVTSSVPASLLRLFLPEACRSFSSGKCSIFVFFWKLNFYFSFKIQYYVHQIIYLFLWFKMVQNFTRTHVFGYTYKDFHSRINFHKCYIWVKISEHFLSGLGVFSEN